MARSAPLLAAHGIGRFHPDTAGDWLYRGIDLELNGGDRTVLVGPTGSGKSLILRALTLLDAVDAGQILWEGTPIQDAEVPAYRAQVVYLQQRSPLVEGTVEDNLRLAFTFKQHREQPFSSTRVLSLFDALGKSAEFLEQPADHLSGGERQMIGLVRALLARPTVLLLDEPTAALDPDAAAAMERVVTDWQREDPEHHAYLWVSHEPAQVDRVGDRMLNLSNGALVETR